MEEYQGRLVVGFLACRINLLLNLILVRITHSNRRNHPSYQVLNPNQSLKSMVLSFKQETVKGILCLVPSLAKDKSDKALALLERGDSA